MVDNGFLTSYARDLVVRENPSLDLPAVLLIGTLMPSWCPAWQSARNPRRAQRGTRCDRSSRPGKGRKMHEKSSVE